MKINRKNLSLAMIRANIDSSKALAEVSGISENTISRINNGSQATLGTIKKLSSALGIEPEEILEAL